MDRILHLTIPCLRAKYYQALYDFKIETRLYTVFINCSPTDHWSNQNSVSGGANLAAGAGGFGRNGDARSFADSSDPPFLQFGRSLVAQRKASQRAGAAVVEMSTARLADGLQ